MTLRRKLVALQVLVVAFGLAVFAGTSFVLYNRSEMHAARTRLQSQVAPLSHELCQLAGCFGPPQGTSSAAGECGTTVDARFIYPTPGVYAELRSQAGAVLARISVPFSVESSPRCPDPELPDRVPLHRFLRVRSSDAAPGPFLVLAMRADKAMASGPVRPGGLGGTVNPGDGAGSAGLAHDVVVVALPISSVTASLRHLGYVYLAVGGALVVLLALLTLLIVRRNMEPLERMVGTAGAIAGGDLSKRVPTGDPHSEIGQLGGALNHMLASIEGAFAERDATEQRLRQFLADASHELRTPLTSIRGYAELWRLASAQDREGAGVGAIDAATAMARIEHHARRMSELVDELLLLARLDEAQPTQREPVDLTVVAAEACDDAVALDPGRPVRLDAPAPVVVAGDASHLRRAVGNLLANAVRHTPAGSPIEVRVAGGGGVAELAVRDHGSGLPPDGLAHAFDRFWQADASRGGGGTGLGLAIVAAVAAEHGGVIGVANAPDGGAVFTLHLPLAPPPGGPGQPVRAASAH